jgi:hypothetical protein
MPTQSKSKDGGPVQPAKPPERLGDSRPQQTPPNGAPPNGQHPGEPTLPGVPLAPPGIPPESDVRVHSPAAATPPKSHGIVEELGELPAGYGDARLVALVRDPTTLYVYWDFSQQQIDGAFAGLGPARAVVKIWNTRQNELCGEADVHLEGRGWYLRELPPGTELRIELWAVGERGARLMRAARPVRLPPALPSDVLEAFYVRLPLDQPLPRDGISAARPLNYGGAVPQGWERRAQPRFTSSLGGAPGSLANLPSSLGGRLPWSGTHLMPDLGDDS